MILAMEEVEALTRQMLDAYRTQAPVAESIRLRDRIVDFARQQNPFFRRLLGDREVPFEEIPLLTKTIVRENFDELVTPSVPPYRREPSTTSGSVGEPMPFLRDTASFPAAYAARRFLKWVLGIPETVVTVWLTNARSVLPPPGWHVVPTWGLKAAQLTEQLSVWANFGNYWIYGMASPLERMACLIEAESLKVQRPLCIVTTGDQLSATGRSMIARAFGGCPVHSWYGSKEIDPSLAGTFPDRPDTYLWNGLRAYLEVVDPDGFPVPPGEIGRIVVTDPYNFAFSLIRYHTDDLAVAPCDSYNSFQTIDGVLGRASELIDLQNGRRVSGLDIGHCLFGVHKFEHDISLYQCAQTAPGAIELRVVWSREPSRQLVESIENALRLVVGAETSITTKGVEQLERLPSDKRAIVIPLKKPA